ncbi:hypothetical protein [Flindersiella endophytica]
MKPGRLLLAALLATLALAVAAPAVRAAGAERVVLAGIGGLRWSDVNRSDTPTLYALAGRGAIGTLSVRTAGDVTCPDDAWLTLSAGQRATAGCRAGSKSWAELAAEQRKAGYQTRIGLLGEALRATGVCATVTGKGAELAVTGASRQAACRLTVADLGALPLNRDQRRAAVRAADRRLAELAAAAGANSTVLVTGLSDEPDATTTSLRLGLAAGPGFARGWLGSSSTRQPGLAQLTDLTPTLTSLLGIRTGHQFVGSPWRTVGERPGNLDDAIAQLNGFDTAERVVRQQSMWLFAGLAVIQLLAYGIAILARRSRPAAIAALLAGAVPVSAFLADLVPWPTAQHPAVTLWIALLTSTAVLAAAAWLTAYLTRRRFPWLAPTVLAGVTTVVLAADVITGSRHQTGNLMTPGDLPVVGGRFFGFGNVAFSIFLTSALFLAGGVAAQLQQAGRRAWPAALAIGAAAVLVDGWPDWGADFGGILAAVPAVVVLTAGVAGLRLTPKRVLLTALAAVAAVTLLAVADWLRPPESRTHLGGFVQQVIDGDALPVVVRKAEMSIGTVTTGGPLAWLAIVVLGLAAAVALRPRRFKANGLSDAYEALPTLRPTVHAVLVLGVVGFAMNDSGLIVPAVVFAVALPLTALAVTLSRAARSVRQPRSAPPW